MNATNPPKGFVTRNSWDLTWMNVAHDVAQRSGCVRAQIGAVVVAEGNRIISTGYNNPPAPYPHTCADACPRARGELEDGYSSCLSVHAELNAILYAPARERLNATIYVSGSVCMDCAKLIAAAGIVRVVMRVNNGDAHRAPERTIAYLMMCGVKVDIWAAGLADHRRVFYETHSGPHHCYFCHELLPYVEVVHHVDHDRENNDPSNLQPAHASCHTSYHSKQPKTYIKTTNPPESRQKKSVAMKGRKPSHQAIEASRNAPRVTCEVCGMVSNAAAITRHRKARGH